MSQDSTAEIRDVVKFYIFGEVDDPGQRLKRIRSLMEDLSGYANEISESPDLIREDLERKVIDAIKSKGSEGMMPRDARRVITRDSGMLLEWADGFLADMVKAYRIRLVKARKPVGMRGAPTVRYHAVW